MFNEPESADNNTLGFKQGNQKIRKNILQIFQRIAQKVAKSKRPKYLQQSSIWKSKMSTSNHF